MSHVSRCDYIVNKKQALPLYATALIPKTCDLIFLDYRYLDTHV